MKIIEFKIKKVKIVPRSRRLKGRWKLEWDRNGFRLYEEKEKENFVIKDFLEDEDVLI